jgi:hypothetical protein
MKPWTVVGYWLDNGQPTVEWIAAESGHAAIDTLLDMSDGQVVAVAAFPGSLTASAVRSVESLSWEGNT